MFTQGPFNFLESGQGHVLQFRLFPYQSQVSLICILLCFYLRIPEIQCGVIVLES